MGDVSTNFSRHEFACKCGCGFQAVDKELLEVLEGVHTHFNAAVMLDCACRCPTHNKAVHGEDKSQHLYGMAADIKVSGVTPDAVATWLEQNHSNGGIGRYDTFTHVDVRGSAARWDKRSGK